MACFSGFRSRVPDVSYYSKVVINFKENGEEIQDLQHADKVMKNLQTFRSQELFTDTLLCVQGQDSTCRRSSLLMDDNCVSSKTSSDDTANRKDKPRIDANSATMEEYHNLFGSVYGESVNAELGNGNLVNGESGELACFCETKCGISNCTLLHKQAGSPVIEIVKKLPEGNKLASTDVCLVCKGEEIHCHRLVLSACNGYFRAMFTQSNMQESNQEKVHLEDGDPDTMRILIHYCYTGVLRLNMQIVFRLLAVAVRYQFDDVEEHCCAFIQRYLGDLGDHVDVFQFAVQVGSSQLTSLAKKVISSNFVEVSRCEQFLGLQSDALAELLELDSLVTDNEQIVYESVMRWLHQDVQNRRNSILRLLSLVRYPYILQKRFKRMIEKDMQEFPECSSLLDKSVGYFLSNYSEKIEIRERIPPRRYYDVSCCLDTHSLSLGYIAEDSINNAISLPRPSLVAGEFIKCVLPFTPSCLYLTSLGKVWVYDFEEQTLSERAPFDSFASEMESLEECSGACLGNVVYFVYTQKEGAVLCFRVYNLDSGEYEELSPPVMEKGEGVGIASLDSIYAISSKVTEEVEQCGDSGIDIPILKYDVIADDWQVYSSLNLPQAERRFLWLLTNNETLYLATWSSSPSCRYTDADGVCVEVYQSNESSTSDWKLLSRANPPIWALPECNTTPSVVIHNNELHFIIYGDESDDSVNDVNANPNVTLVVVDLNTGRNHVRHGYLPMECVRERKPQFFVLHKYLLA